MGYRMKDDSVTVKGKGHPEYSGKSVTKRGEQQREEKGPEPGRYDVSVQGHPERLAGKSTARDITGVNPENPILKKKMPTLV